MVGSPSHWGWHCFLCGKSYSVKADKSQLSKRMHTFILFLLLTVAMTSSCFELLRPATPPTMKNRNLELWLTTKELHNSPEWRFCQNILS